MKLKCYDSRSDQNMSGKQKYLLNNAIDHLFYTQSYQDLHDLSDSESATHFEDYGFQEGRFCSSYHFFKSHQVPFAGCISFEEFKKESNLDKKTTLLNTCEIILQNLSLGMPSKYDQQYFFTDETSNNREAWQDLGLGITIQSREDKSLRMDLIVHPIPSGNATFQK